MPFAQAFPQPVNELGEDTFASPVPSQGQIFLRGVKHLFAVGAGRK